MKLAYVIPLLLATASELVKAQEREEDAIQPREESNERDSERQGTSDDTTEEAGEGEPETSNNNNADDEQDERTTENDGEGSEGDNSSPGDDEVTSDDVPAASNPGPKNVTSDLVGGPWELPKIRNIPRAIRRSWCVDQVSTCSKQCVDGGNRADNPICNVRDLSWTCRCRNGASPDLAKEDFTIPFFQCRYDWQVCNEACTPGDQACVDVCNEQFSCGTGKPAEVVEDSTDENDAGGSGERSGAKADDTQSENSDPNSSPKIGGRNLVLWTAFGTFIVGML